LEEKQAAGDKQASVGVSSSKSPPVVIPTPVPAKAKHDWYQTETHVIVTVMLKHVKKEDLNIDIQDTSLSVTVKISTGNDYNLEVDLAHPISPEKSTTKVMSTKFEIKLKKQDGIRWTKLESDGKVPDVKHFNPSGASSDAASKYPSSSQNSKDWDKIVTEIKKEEKDEKLEGDAALNQLFEQIYSDGSEEVKRAMNKSFMESGGTCLSTNWKDIGKKKTEIKPPDGMEWKEYDK
jgi:suppressor of G2 allele of SKP1